MVAAGSNPRRNRFKVCQGQKEYGSSRRDIGLVHEKKGKGKDHGKNETTGRKENGVSAGTEENKLCQAECPRLQGRGATRHSWIGFYIGREGEGSGNYDHSHATKM